jgi:hypothetical protein
MSSDPAPFVTVAKIVTLSVESEQTGSTSAHSTLTSGFGVMLISTLSSAWPSQSSGPAEAERSKDKSAGQSAPAPLVQVTTILVLLEAEGSSSSNGRSSSSSSSRGHSQAGCASM